MNNIRVGEFIKELERYNPNLPLKRWVLTREGCYYIEPTKPKIEMVDDVHHRELENHIVLAYTYEKKPILVI